MGGLRHAAKEIITAFQHNRHPTTMWEYKIITSRAKGFWGGGKVDPAELEAMMNELGAQGWELVNAFDTNEGYGSTRDVVMVFKRQQ